MSTNYDAALARLRTRASAGALTPATRTRLNALRDQMKKSEEERKRTAAAHSVDAFLAATPTQKGSEPQEESEGGTQYNITQQTTPACDERRGSGVYLHGHELPRDGEGA